MSFGTCVRLLFPGSSCAFNVPVLVLGLGLGGRDINDEYLNGVPVE